MNFVPAHLSYSIEVHRTLKGDNQLRWWPGEDVVAFDDHGNPLILGRRGLVHANDAYAGTEWRIEEQDNHHDASLVAAAPGWVALFALHLKERTTIERHPVAAWHGSHQEWDCDAIIITPHEYSDGFPAPVPASDYARTSNIEPLGVYHPDHLPEPVDIAEQAHLLRTSYLQRETRRQASLSNRLPADSDPRVTRVTT